MPDSGIMSANRNIDFRYAPDLIQTCIGFAYDDYKTIVREDGSLNYLYELGKEVFIDGTEPPCSKRVLDRQEGNAAFKYRFVPRFYHRDKLIKRCQDFGDPKAAIVTTIEEYEHSIFRWTIFAHKTETGARMDIILFTLSAGKNFGHACENIYLQALGDAPLPGSVMPPPLNHHDVLPYAKEWRPAPSVVVTPIICGGKEVTYPRPVLHAGEVWEGAFGVVYRGAIREEDFTYEYAKTALEHSKIYWHDLETFRLPFHIPDKDLQDMLDASARNIIQAMEIKADTPHYNVGPTIYRGFWINDNLGFTEASFFMGRDEEARGGQLEMLAQQKPDGSIIYIGGLFGETATAAATIVRHCELENNDERLRELWPMILRGVAFLRKLNDESKQLGDNYPGYGLFPPSFGDGGLFGNEAEYSNPGTCITRLTLVYEAGKRCGLEGWENIRELCETLRANARSKFPRDMKTTADGIRYLPASMQYDTRHKPQLHIGTILNFIDDDDPLWDDYFRLLDTVDDAQGIPECTGWRSDQSLFPYSALLYAKNLLERGHGEKAIDYLYAFCNHAAPSRVWREEQPLRDSTCAEACGDMPHNWASSLLINTVRYYLVNERRKNLDLLWGLPDEWLPNDGNILVLGDTPTRFGRISLRIASEGNGKYKITYERKDGNQVPEALTLRWKGKICDADCAVGQGKNYFYSLPPQNKTITLTVEK